MESSVPTDHIRGTVSSDVSFDAPPPLAMERRERYSRVPKNWFIGNRYIQGWAQRYCRFCATPFHDEDDERNHIKENETHIKRAGLDYPPWTRFTEHTKQTI